MSQPRSNFEPPRMRDVTSRVLLRYLSHLSVGTRLLPIKDLARELNVGQSSLHESLRNLAKRGLVVSRQRLGTFLARPVTEAELEELKDEPVAVQVEGAPIASRIPGVQPNALLGRTVDLCMAPRPDWMIQEMADASREALMDRGAKVRVRYWTRNHQIAAPAGSSDYTIYFNPSPTICVQVTGPHAVISTSLTPATYNKSDGDIVWVDQEQSAQLAGIYLRRQGVQEACFIGCGGFGARTRFDEISRARLVGFESGLGRGVEKANQLNAGGYSLIGGGKAFRRYSERSGRPAVIFAVCDDVAAGFVIAAASNGLEAGRDYWLIGFDGLGMGKCLPEEGELSTVEIPARDMGLAGANAALARLSNPGVARITTKLECRFLEGTTTGAALAV